MTRETRRPEKTAQIEYLTSWKEISQYMHAGVRTVQRYERDMGLPIRRPTGKSRGAVMATKAELDAWIVAIPIHKAFELSRTTNVASAKDKAEQLRRGLEDMLNLRIQMQELRDETRSAMNLLINKVSAMRDLIPSSRLDGYEPLVGIEYEPPKRRVT